MAYQMIELLKKCEKEDTKFIIDTIDSYINFTDDKGLKEEFSKWNTHIMPISLAQKLETEIRYLGSNDIAYALRKLSGHKPAGIDANEIVNDIAKIQKIKLKQVTSFEANIEELTKRMVVKRFSDLTPEQQRELLKQSGVSNNEINLFFERIKDNKELLIPILVQVFGKKVASELIKSIVTGIIARFIGKKAAEQLLKELGKRLPFQTLGPIMWIGSLAWLTIDLCGPAMRKLIPIMLMLGMVALRDGPEEGKNFLDPPFEG